MTTRVYVSSEAWRAIPQWQASHTPTVGDYCRQLGPTIYPGWSGNGGGSSDVATANFGGTSFAHAAPTGYSAWDAAATFDAAKSGPAITLSGGNLTATRPNASAWQTILATTGRTSGKYYFEMTIGSISASDRQIVGFGLSTMNLSSFLGDTSPGLRSMGYQSSGALVNISSGWSVGATYTTGDVIGVALDLDLRMVWWRKNGGSWNNDNLSDPVAGIGGMGYGGFLSSIPQGNERVFKATTVTGNTGSSEPSWNLGNNATTTDGSVTWTQVAGQESQQAAGNWKAPHCGLQALANANPSPTTIFISSDHREVSQINVGFSQNWGRIDVLCVSRTGASLPPTDTDLVTIGNGANIGSGGNQNCQLDAAYVYGVQLSGGSANGFGGVILQPTTPSEWEACEFDNGGTGGANIQLGNTGKMRFVNCKVSSRTQSALVMTGQAPGGYAVEFVGLLSGSFNGVQMFAQGDGNYPVVKFRGCDLSSATRIFATTLNGGRATSGLFEFDNCKLPASEPFGGNGTAWNDNQEYRFFNCENGGNVLSKLFQLTGYGDLQSTYVAARSGGATDPSGGTALGWKFTGNGSGLRTFLTPHRTVPVAVLNTATGSSKTASVYLCSSVALDNSLAWLDLDTLEDSGDTLATRRTSRAKTSIATPANLTTDTSDWTAGSVSARANSHAYSLGDLIKLASNPGRLFICTTAGTSAGSEPGGYATAVDGGTVTDSGAVFTAVRRYVIQITFTPGRIGIVEGKVNVGAIADTATVFIDPLMTVA